MYGTGLIVTVWGPPAELDVAAEDEGAVGSTMLEGTLPVDATDELATALASLEAELLEL